MALNFSATKIRRPEGTIKRKEFTQHLVTTDPSTDHQVTLCSTFNKNFKEDNLHNVSNQNVKHY
jgi:hypothetical protein